MTGVPMLIAPMFLEIIFEVIVDAFALSIEWKHGIDLNKFWAMWRVNASAFWGGIVFQGFVAIMSTCWAFKLIPNAIFCTSPTDPCSCLGGGFEIYNRFCNKTNDNRTKAPSVDQAEKEFKGIFDALEGDSETILVSVGMVALTAAVFALAHSQLKVTEIKRVRDALETEKVLLLEQKVELQEQNKKIQDELALRALNDKQVKVVHAGAAMLEAEVPERFRIASTDITFEALLGSGSFGDCYKGYFHNVPVAAKQMRVVGFLFWICTKQMQNEAIPKLTPDTVYPTTNETGPRQRGGLQSIC